MDLNDILWMVSPLTDSSIHTISSFLLRKLGKIEHFSNIEEGKGSQKLTCIGPRGWWWLQPVQKLVVSRLEGKRRCHSRFSSSKTSLALVGSSAYLWTSQHLWGMWLLFAFHSGHRLHPGSRDRGPQGRGGLTPLKKGSSCSPKSQMSALCIHQ